MDERGRQLQDMVDVDDLDAVLRCATLDEIAISWCRYSGRERPSDDGVDDVDEDPDWWAVELFMGRSIFERNDLYRALLLRLVEHATENTLGAIGAGPLENFVSDNDSDLQWLERECRTNSRLRNALANVWCDGDVSEATMIRLDAAAGTPLSRMRPREEWPPELIEVEDARYQLYAIVGRDWTDIDNPTEHQREIIDRYLAATAALLHVDHSGDHPATIETPPN